MLQMIKSEKTLKPYLYYVIEDEGIEVGVEPTLSEDEYVAIKVDDYYNGLHVVAPPKSVDFIVVVDCSCDAFVLYIFEIKNVKSSAYLRIRDIQDKFETTINDFMQEKYNHIFCNDKFKYKDLKLYLVSDVYGIQGKFQTHQEYRNYMDKINKKDSLKVDNNLGNKLFRFRGKLYSITYDIPPNPVIKKIV